jgi:hypothetical protein
VHHIVDDDVTNAPLFSDVIDHFKGADVCVAQLRLQWSGEPALYTRKHRGKRYDEIAVTDRSYLEWIIDESELEEGVKHSARHWLDLVTPTTDDT